MSNSLAKCKLCRREGDKLFLKGDRCTTQKCAIVRRNFPPGSDGSGSNKHQRVSEFGKQLREKQKAKRTYRLRERQFRLYFDKADKVHGVTGDNLIGLLETRLDNFVYRMGLAKSRSQARQIVSHGHIMVNGRKVNIPSYALKIGDEVSIRENDLEKEYFKDLVKSVNRDAMPTWLNVEVHGKNMKGKVLAVPGLKDIDQSIDTHTIVEYYSRQ
ncbi:30S ribosomal protein S4 [Patescibacteria group bacterium]|nr:30S ribosomal protein S4 [Patescibacteria group bacterium]